jgi:Mg2+/Co2+ transporter CorB
METLASTEHTWLPVYHGSLDNVVGMLHVRSALNYFACQTVDKPALVKAAEDVYFIPENTPLDVQLFNFQKRKCRIGLVIDEYGDIEGLATLEDIFEEIIGEFTTDWASTGMEITPDATGRGYIIEGRVSVRDINRTLHTNLPTNGPRTFSGLIVEHLEELPNTPVCVTINGCGIEIIQTKAKRVAKARLLLSRDVYNKISV